MMMNDYERFGAEVSEVIQHVESLDPPDPDMEAEVFKARDILEAVAVTAKERANDESTADLLDPEGSGYLPEPPWDDEVVSPVPSIDWHRVERVQHAVIDALGLTSTVDKDYAWDCAAYKLGGRKSAPPSDPVRQGTGDEGVRRAAAIRAAVNDEVNTVKEASDADG